MKTVTRRLDRIEEELGATSGKRDEILRVVCTRADTLLALDVEGCVKVLEEYGFLPTGREATVIMLADIPDGLDVSETREYLRTHGAALCGTGT